MTNPTPPPPAPPGPSTAPQTYLSRQIATMLLSCARTETPMALLRAAAWHNTAARLGVVLPLFVVHDLGLLLTASTAGGAVILGEREAALTEAGLWGEERTGLRADLSRYAELLRELSRSEVTERLSGWRLRDELIAVLLVKILSDTYHRFPDPAKRAGVSDLPLEPQAYATSPTHVPPGDLRAALHFLRFLVSGNHPLGIATQLEQIDTDTVRLLAMFTPLGQLGQAGPGVVQSLGASPVLAGTQLDLLDLFGVFQSAEASDVANFSLDLLPSVLETRRASGVQVFSADGYAAIERRGNLDSLVLSELAYDDDLFTLKAMDDELLYYGHEKQRDEERRLQYILLDASPSMRGLRQVFCRGLALTLGKQLTLSGDEVWLRFFDARLSDPVRLTRHGADYATPYLLSYRTERGRNYGRVFRQLAVELQRLRRDERRQVVLYILTHGQCHIPAEVVQALSRLCYLYGVFILPSADVELDYLPLLHRHQVVSESILTSQKDRRDRALQIVEDAARLRQEMHAGRREAATMGK